MTIIVPPTTSGQAIRTFSLPSVREIPPPVAPAGSAW
jgi:hypothetical protein